MCAYVCILCVFMCVRARVHALMFVFLFSWGQISLWSPDWPQTSCNPPISACRALADCTQQECLTEQCSMTVCPAAAERDSRHLLLTLTLASVFDTRVFFITDKMDLTSERLHLLMKLSLTFPWPSRVKLRGRKGKLSELRKSLTPENLTGNKWLNLQTSAQI